MVGYENSFLTSQLMRNGDSECGTPRLNQEETDWLIAVAFYHVNLPGVDFWITVVFSLPVLPQGSWWKRSMAKPQHQLSESHSLTVSPTSLSMFTITVSYVLLHFGSILSTDSIFIFISRQLCGKCFVMALVFDHRL